MLSKRLKTVTDAVGKAACVLDMGCDHGYVPLALIQNHQAKHVIASDISAPSLDKAKHQIASAHLEDVIETRLGGGLDIILKDECDAIIMAGMGGLLISDILQQDFEKVAHARLVLQPMNHAATARLTLEKIGFCIQSERVVFEDGHYYEIIMAEPGDMQVKEPIDYWVGYTPARRKDDDFVAHVKALLTAENKIITNLQNKKTENVRRRLAQCRGYVDMLEEVLS